LISVNSLWHSTFKEQVNPGPRNQLGEEKMETLTNEEMIEIEGGDWGGFGAGAGLAVLLCLCL
jgi:hypothetical protein